jgi:hypothetical protein
LVCGMGPVGQVRDKSQMRAHGRDTSRQIERWLGCEQEGCGVVHRSLTFGRRAPSRNAAPCKNNRHLSLQGAARRATNPNGGATRPVARFSDADPPQPAAQIAGFSNRSLAARGVTRSPNLARGSRRGRCPRLRYRSGADHEANRPPPQASCAAHPQRLPAPLCQNIYNKGPERAALPFPGFSTTRRRNIPWSTNNSIT